MFRLFVALGTGIGNTAVHETSHELAWTLPIYKYPVTGMDCSESCVGTYESVDAGGWRFVGWSPPIHWSSSNQCNLTKYLLIVLRVNEKSRSARLEVCMSAYSAKSYWQSIHEFLFTLLIAWLSVWRQNMTSRPIWIITSPWTSRWTRWVHSYWLTVSPEPVVVIEQVVWSGVVGTGLFLLLSVYRRFRPLGSYARAITGVVSIVGFPLFALLFPRYFPFGSESRSFLLLLETVGVLICSVLYWFEKWPCGISPTVVLLFLHFSLWAWVTGMWPSPLQEMRSPSTKISGVLISTLFFCGFPLLSFLSAVTWGLSRRAPERNYVEHGTAR